MVIDPVVVGIVSLACTTATCLDFSLHSLPTILLRRPADDDQIDSQVFMTLRVFVPRPPRPKLLLCIADVRLSIIYFFFFLFLHPTEFFLVLLDLLRPLLFYFYFFVVRVVL